MPNALVSIENGKVTTSSLIVAQHFTKRHANILRSIQNLECSQNFRQLNFELAEYKDEQNKPRQYYIITKDGFMFLVMGFTGKQAAIWKERFIEAFNAMEARLKSPDPLPEIMAQVKLALSEITQDRKPKYYYPKRLLDQEYFNGGHNFTRVTGLQLTHPKFVSPMEDMLNRLERDGHIIDACRKEFEGMKKALTSYNEFLEKIQEGIISTKFKRH